MEKRSPLLRGALAVLFIAIVANFGALKGTNPKSSNDGDGPFYISLARNLAAGNGYVLGESFWPTRPTMGRAPVWPALLSVGAVLTPSSDDTAVLRGTAAWLNVGNALLIFGITFLLSRNWLASALAGAVYAAYPVALALTAGGFSEIPFVFVAGAGIFLLLLGRRWMYLGALVMGLSPLVRSNFILLPVMAGLVALPKMKSSRDWSRLVVLAGIFWLPSALWIARNYALSGEFPVLSTIEGETLYGANNDYVASNLSLWGYWVFPNLIPGETSKKDLASTMSERQVDVYYHRKGIAYLKAHWFDLPRTELGKLIRAFMPVPWVAGWGSYAVFFLRGVLYAAIILSLRRLRQMDGLYQTIVIGMFLVVLATVLIYYGTYRFTFCVEIFLIPAVALWVFSKSAWLKRVSGCEETVTIS